MYIVYESVTNVRVTVLQCNTTFLYDAPARPCEP